MNNHPVYKKTKCFYVVFGEEKWLFSYLLAINGGLSDEKKFYISCRNSIKTVLHEFKTKIFKNKPVRFAVTKNILTWETCQIDHKAPMTFSVIVKTFIKAKNIEVTDVELSGVVSPNRQKFQSSFLSIPATFDHLGVACRQG